MSEILDALDEAVGRAEPVVFTVLVETRGSTPQKAGASMLVFPDGRQVGTLGGGCVEAEVKRRALELLPRGTSDLMTFSLDNDYGWDDGLICGGRMMMLVEPVTTSNAVDYHGQLRAMLSQNCGGTEAIVMKDDAGIAASPGTRFLFNAEGELLSGPEEQAARVRSLLKPLTERPRPYVASGISFLPHLPKCRLIIVGAGHVGQKVAELAHEVDFDVTVIDDREQYCNADRFPSATQTIVGAIDETLPALQTDVHSYGIIVTRGHNHDEEALGHLARKPFRYLGMIGSRRKIKLIFRDLLEAGLTAEQLGRVHAPLGFNIGSQTVPEIAVSIVAELIAHRNLGGIPDRCRPDSLVHEL